MPIPAKQRLSGSTDGKGIKVVATATPGTTIHTAVSGTVNFDEIYIQAVNSDTVIRKLTIEWGGVTVPDDLIELNIPPEDGLYWVVQGNLLQNGQIVRAFAAAANVIVIHGFVNRITV